MFEHIRKRDGRIVTFDSSKISAAITKAAKTYIIYKEQHAQIRAIATKTSVDLVENYLQKQDWKIKENSNMCYSLQGVEQLLGRIHISERFRKAPGCFSTRDSRPMNWMTEGEIENYEA